VLTVELQTSNAAFASDSDSAGEECARILVRIADRLRDGEIEGICRDYNGNRVGVWILRED
jgi:hypothetical protein